MRIKLKEYVNNHEGHQEHEDEMSAFAIFPCDLRVLRGEITFNRNLSGDHDIRQHFNRLFGPNLHQAETNTIKKC